MAIFSTFTQIFSTGLKSRGPLLSSESVDFGGTVYSPPYLETCGKVVESDTQIILSWRKGHLTFACKESACFWCYKINSYLAWRTLHLQWPRDWAFLLTAGEQVKRNVFSKPKRCTDLIWLLTLSVNFRNSIFRFCSPVPLTLNSLVLKTMPTCFINCSMLKTDK